jgi:hypothetical protein
MNFFLAGHPRNALIRLDSRKEIEGNGRKGSGLWWLVWLQSAPSRACVASLETPDAEGGGRAGRRKCRRVGAGPGMAPQPLEKVGFAPGNRMARQCWTPQHLVLGARPSSATAPSPLAGCRGGERGCDARVSPTPLLVAAHPHMAPQSFENIDSAPGNGMGAEASTPIMWVESSAPPRLRPGPGRARSWPGC